MKIKKGDQVVVVAGRDKGRSGLVIAAYPDRGKVLVQGVNVVKKNKKVTYQGQGVAERVEPSGLGGEVVDPWAGVLACSPACSPSDQGVLPLAPDQPGHADHHRP